MIFHNKTSCVLTQLSFLLLLLSACTAEAPRDNPLDPASDLYNPAAAISGKCTRLYDNTSAVPGVTVTLQALSGRAAAGQIRRSTTSDSTGFFSFRSVEPGNYTLIFTKTGFVSDTLSISLSERQQASMTVPLDSRPVVTYRKLATGHASRIGNDQYFLDFSTEVIDPDRNLDIENVFCTIPGLDIQLPLFPDRDRLRWQRLAKFDSLLAARTGGSPAPIDTLIGMPIFIDISTVTANNDSATTRSGPFYLTRVISDEVILNFPKADTLVSRRPLFSWSIPQASYTITSTVQIVWLATLSDHQYYRFRGVTATTLQPGFDLPVGNFFWTVEIRDQFGNWSRSLEATFKTTDR